MNNDEFNEFLRSRAEKFEVKPTTGSFNAMAAKMAKPKRNRLKLWLPVAAILITGLVAAYIFTLPAKRQAGQTIASTVNAPQIPTPGTTNAAENAEQIEQLNGKPGTTTPAAITTIDDKETIADNKFVRPLKTTATQNFENSTAKGDGLLPLKNIDSAIATAAIPAAIIADTVPPAADMENAIAKADSTKKKDGHDAPKLPKLCRLGGQWTILAYYGFLNPTYYAVNNTSKNTATPSGYGKNNEDVIPAAMEDINTIPDTSIHHYYTVKEKKAHGGWEAGLLVNRRIAGNWTLATGLGMSRWEETQTLTLTEEYMDSFESKYFDPALGRFVTQVEHFSVRNELETRSYSKSFTSISVPVALGYTANYKKLDLNFRAGLTFNYISSTNPTLTDRYKDTVRVASPLNTDYTPQWPAYRKFTTNATAGVFVGYKIMPCLSIYAGPKISVSFNPLTKGSQQKTYPFYRGLEAGLRLTL